jgi:hypothetical protein
MHLHAGQHGGWAYQPPTPQYFFEHFCGVMDGSDASNGDIPPQPRFHMRYFWNYDSGIWQYYSVSTPHHEDLLYCGHAVDSNNNEPPGGFVMGKWDIGFNWHNWNGGGGLHYFGGSWWWGNTQMFLQCDGEWAWNDGWLDFVEIRGAGH